MLPRGGLSLILGAALFASGCASARDDITDPPRCNVPTFLRAETMTNPNNVLSLYVRGDVRDADSVVVQFGLNGALDNVTPAADVTGDSVRAVVLGLYPNRVYGVEAVAYNRCGSTMSDLMSFTTGSLPSDLPRYRTSGAAPLPGFVVFAAGNYGIVIDNTGRVVWYRHFPNGLGLNFQPQPDGRYSARPSVEAGKIANWVEIDPDGNVSRTLGCDHGLQPRMHDMIAQTDGSYWLLCDETRTVDLSAQGKSATAKVLGTAVQWRSATGEMIFEWSPFDHLTVDLSVLDPADLTGPSINWTHGNAIDLASDGNPVISYRNLSQITKIDVRTGAIIWRIGGAKNEFAFDNSAVPAFAHQHGVRAAGAEGLILLDNLGELLGSRAERYEIDEVHHVARLAGTFASSDGVTAQIGGSTQPLPDGHTLVSFGSGGGVEEYDAAGNVVWRLDGNPGYVFKAQRIRSLYRPGFGDPR